MQNKFKVHNLSLPKHIWEAFCFGLLLVSNFMVAQPTLQFKKVKQNFGFVKKGAVVKIEFEFTNTGNQPLLITDAKAECSCTTIKFNSEPILPNQLNKITIMFDTKTVYDRQDRIIEIISNSKTGKQKLRFKGVVLN